MLNKCITWIEDDVDVIAPLLKPMRDDGFEILEYRTYSEAMDNLDRISKSDLILMDIILPPGNSKLERKYLGVYLLEQFRKEQIHIPAIIFSVVASAPDINLDELTALDATTISKPVRPSQLRRQLYERLGIDPDETD